MDTKWEVGELEECAGYDCMYHGIRVGPVVLDGQLYGQKSCDELSSELAVRMLADAHLIAAAPELYKALEAMVSNACAACEVLEDGTHRVDATKAEWDAHTAATDLARAALAKAKP